MLTNEFPFTSIADKCFVGKIAFPTYISKECEDLILQMTKVDPEERIPLFEIEKHPWMTKESEELKSTPEITAS
jgi:serine/threonine protein kinase